MLTLPPPTSCGVAKALRRCRPSARQIFLCHNVLPHEAFVREAAFVRLELLEATEDYRDGRGSRQFDWPGSERPEGERIYPSFRLYARSIYDVSELRNLLMDQGLEIYTKAEEIETVLAADPPEARVEVTLRPN